MSNSPYSTIKCGTPHSPDYRIFLKGPTGPISPMHDVPLYHDDSGLVFNMVVEIPRWSNAKFEICKEDLLNPIRQDVKKGKLRYVHNIFPYKGYLWNYGALPQTWEDPSHVDRRTHCRGDNDPLDVCEIGEIIRQPGDVVQVKMLGVLALIDEGETDWKLLAIDVTDPLAEKLNDITDVDKVMPGYLQATREWLRHYKLPYGNYPNGFAFGGDFLDKKSASQIIDTAHRQWRNLVTKKAENRSIYCENVTVTGSPYLIDNETAKRHVERADLLPPATLHPQQPEPEDFEKWHFVPEMLSSIR